MTSQQPLTERESRCLQAKDMMTLPTPHTHLYTSVQFHLISRACPPFFFLIYHFCCLYLIFCATLTPLRPRAAGSAPCPLPHRYTNCSRLSKVVVIALRIGLVTAQFHSPSQFHVEGIDSCVSAFRQLLAPHAQTPATQRHPNLLSRSPKRQPSTAAAGRGRRG